jgi:hypothetical protein
LGEVVLFLVFTGNIRRQNRHSKGVAAKIFKRKEIAPTRRVCGADRVPMISLVVSEFDFIKLNRPFTPLISSYFEPVFLGDSLFSAIPGA